MDAPQINLPPRMRRQVSVEPPLAVLHAVHAANIWDGGGANANWDTLANWDDDNLPASTADVTFGTPSAPLLANADAIVLSDGEACRDELIDHLTRGVDWVTAVETMVGAGTDVFLEVGPGKVLTGLVRRIAGEATTVAIDDITTEQGLELPA